MKFANRFQPAMAMVLLLLFGAGGIALADASDDAARAFQTKDYKKAAELWKAQAERGDAVAHSFPSTVKPSKAHVKGDGPISFRYSIAV